MLNEEKIKYYLSIYNKSFLYQKTGFLLEQIKDQANISDALIEFCRNKSENHVKWLINDEDSDAFVNKWRLYVPKNLKYKEDYELI